MKSREFLSTTGHGFGMVALSGLLEAANQPAGAEISACSSQSEEHHLPLHARRRKPRGHFRSEARANPPHRPASLVELAKTIKTSFIHDPTKAILRGSPWQFQPGRKCGLPVSDLFPTCASAWTISP